MATAALLVVLPASPQNTNSSQPGNAPNREWPVYGGNPEGSRYSPLKQIDRSNVSRLRVAWTYEASNGGGAGGLQTNPIIVHGILYSNTPGGLVVALNGATGKL